MTRTHLLKIQDKYFDRIIVNQKKFELRKNDRDFQVNDVVLFKPIDEDGTALDHALEVKIIYILQNVEFGLKKGYCIFGFEKLVYHEEYTW